jgi:hypothetical protein
VARRKPDTLAEFRLLEACRFGGDATTALETLRVYAFDSVTLQHALNTLRAGVHAAAADADTRRLDAALARRLAYAQKRQNRAD